MSTTDAKRWHDWRDVTTEDLSAAPVIADLAPSKLLEPRAERFSVGVITVKGWEEIVVRFFGVGDPAKTYTVYILGWMSNGPGEIFYSGVVVLGNKPFASGYLLSSREDGPPVIWTEGVIGVIADDDAYLAIESGAATTLPTAHVTMPTGGYEHLQLFVRGIGGGGADRARIIYRKSKLNQGR